MAVNETLDTIKRRRSARSFLEKQIEDQDLHAVLEAGLYAPSAGIQPWHFTVVQNASLLRRINESAKEAARRSDVPHFQSLGKNENFHCLYGAPTLIIVSCGKKSVAPEQDCAAATQNMLLAAESLGLGACWIYFALLAFQSARGAALRAELKLPKDHMPYTSISLGHRAKPAERTPERRKDSVTYI